jgi:hypothetical protein
MITSSRLKIKSVQGDYMPTINRYGAELARKKDQRFRIDIDSNRTDDLFLILGDGQDDNNPMITIVFKPEDIAGKKSIRFNATDSNKCWDIKFSDGIKFDRVIIPQK